MGPPLAAHRLPWVERLWARGCPASCIAAVLGYSSGIAVSATARRLGLSRREGGRRWVGGHLGLWSADETEVANYLFDEGVPVEEIAVELKRHPSAVRAQLRYTGDRFGSRKRKYNVYKAQDLRNEWRY